MPIYAVTNDQAHTGKTTTSVNLAAFLGGFGAPTLIVDCDPSGDATAAIGRRAVTFGLFRVLTEERLEGAVAPGAVQGVDVVMGGPRLRTLDHYLRDADQPERRLRTVLEPLQNHYTYMILDCPTEAGMLRTAAILAADAVIVPVACRPGAAGEAGTSLSMVRETAGRGGSAPRAALLRTLLDPHDADAVAASREARSAYPQLTLATRVPLDPALARAQEQGEPVLNYAPDSGGSRAYQILALEIAERTARSA